MKDAKACHSADRAIAENAVGNEKKGGAAMGNWLFIPINR